MELRTANAGLTAAVALSSAASPTGHPMPAHVHPSQNPVPGQTSPQFQAPSPLSSLQSTPSASLWESPRTLLFQPSDPEVRRWPISTVEFATRLDSALQNIDNGTSTPVQGRRVELARRTSRGDFVVQIFEHAWTATRQVTRLSVPSLGDWTVSMNANAHSAISVVFKGISTALSTAALRADFILSNAKRFPGIDARSLDDGVSQVERLKRRCKGGTNSNKWVESTAVRFSFSRQLGEAVLRSGAAIIQYAVHPAFPFKPPQRHCARCGILGHLAAYCRNQARCRNCGAQGSHETISYPHLMRAHRSNKQVHTDGGMEGAAAAPYRPL